MERDPWCSMCPLLYECMDPVMDVAPRSVTCVALRYCYNMLSSEQYRSLLRALPTEFIDMKVSDIRPDDLFDHFDGQERIA